MFPTHECNMYVHIVCMTKTEEYGFVSATSLASIRHKNNCLTASEDVPNYDCSHGGILTCLFSPFNEWHLSPGKRKCE